MLCYLQWIVYTTDNEQLSYVVLSLATVTNKTNKFIIAIVNSEVCRTQDSYLKNILIKVNLQARNK